MTSTAGRPDMRWISWPVIAGMTAALTVPMLGLICLPFWWRHWGYSVVWDLLLGFNGLGLFNLVIYLGGLTLYTRRLRSLLGRIPDRDRAVPLYALWLVIAVPFNFVGSFFAIGGTARSLMGDGRLSPGHVQRWRWLGITWCSFQVLAFFPNMAVSLTALLISYALWAAHWVYSVTLDEQLASDKEAIGE